jgi:hypothetical protein
VVGLVEGGDEVVEQRLGATVAVRLEDRDDAPLPAGAGGGQWSRSMLVTTAIMGCR